MKKLAKDAHICHCGGGDIAPHQTGSKDCYRFVVTDPNEIPTKWSKTVEHTMDLCEKCGYEFIKFIKSAGYRVTSEEKEW